MLCRNLQETDGRRIYGRTEPKNESTGPCSSASTRTAFTKEETATETTLDELEALLNTAGGECAGKVLQNKHTPDPRSFIGEGKAEEVRQLVLVNGREHGHFRQ